MRQRTRKALERLGAMGIALALLCGGAVVGSFAPPAWAASNTKGVLTVGTDILSGTTVGPVEFDPAQFTVREGYTAYDLPIYGGLLRQTPSGAFLPDLASKVTVPNPSTIDLVIRSGAVFSDGTPFTAAAVKAGLERNVATTHQGAFTPYLFAISSIDQTGTNGLTLNFSQPVANLFYPYLSDEESFIVSPTAAAAGTLGTHPVGAGPFMLKSYGSDQQIVLVKNPRYWNAKSIHLSGITFVEVPSGPQQVNALKTGLVNIEEGVPANYIPTLKGPGSLQVKSSFVDGGYYFAPICKSSGPLAKVQVRQALSYAVNRPAINNAILYGEGQPAWSLFPTTNALYDKSLTGYYAYDPAKAKRLLAQAGYPHGFSTTIMPLPMPSNTQVATILQAEWKKIGVNVQIVSTSDYVNDLYVRNKSPIGLNPSGTGGLGKVAGPYTTGSIGDLCNYSSPALTQLANQASALPPNSPQLRSVWFQIQQFVIKNALSIYVAFSPTVAAATKAVHNVSILPGYIGGVLNYSGMSVS